MTLLFARVRSAAEAERVGRAGFDGVLGEDRGPAAGGLAHLSPAGPARLHLDDATGRRTIHAARDAPPDAPAMAALVVEGMAGLLLDSAARLLDGTGIAALGDCRTACRETGLLCGFAGGLEPPDVPRLLALDPDLLVFDGALRNPAGALDDRALALLRGLVPRDGEGGRPDPSVTQAAPDRIFLHDLVLSVAIGAYAQERGRLQRVRFSVEAALRPTGRPTRDMRDVVSYDLFSDAITALTTGRHVDFVETLAEDIAAMVLTHPRILSCRVTVEKLDVGPRAVGVSIERRKAGPD